MKKLLARPEALLICMGLVFLSASILASYLSVYAPQAQKVIYVTKEEKEALVKNEKTDSVLINLNTATLEELCELEGVSTVTAQAIIDYRTEVGGFKDIEELLSIKGIGEVKYKSISPYVTLQ